MESKLNQESKRLLVEQSKKMSANERLKAYVEHVKVLAELYKSGIDSRKKNSNDD